MKTEMIDDTICVLGTKDGWYYHTYLSGIVDMLRSHFVEPMERDGLTGGEGWEFPDKIEHGNDPEDILEDIMDEHINAFRSNHQGYREEGTVYNKVREKMMYKTLNEVELMVRKSLKVYNKTKKVWLDDMKYIVNYIIEQDNKILNNESF